MRQWIAAWRQRWLARRIPPAPEIRLHRGNLFILPSRFGLGYLLLCLALFVLGTNYQNNLILALTLLLLSLFVTSIWHAYFNLAGLTVSAEPLALGQVDSPLPVSLRVTAPHPVQSLRLDHPQALGCQLARLTHSERLTLLFTPCRRGPFAPGRVTLQSHYPLGLLRCWTHLDLAQQTLVAPRPVPCALPLTGLAGQGQHAQQALHAPPEELAELRPYRPGEPLSRLAWRQLAQGRGKLTKVFDAPQGPAQWLDLAQTPGTDLELRLGQLCHQVLQLSQRQHPFGLKLANWQLPPDSGPEQTRQALSALARFGLRP